MPAEVLVVVGARGGCGASTLAALLARHRVREGMRAGARSRGGRRRGARPERVALVDLDHTGGGIDVLLGAEGLAGARWADLGQVRGTFSAADLDGVLPRWEGVEVLSADRRPGRPAEASRAAVWGALVAGCATVVVDLPARDVLEGPHPDLADLLAARTDLLLLVPQDVLGVSGAVGVRAALPAGPVQVVVRRRAPARVSPLEVARALDLPLLADVSIDRGVAGATDRGLGPLPRPWSRLARAVGRIARGTAAADVVPGRAEHLWAGGGDGRDG